PVLARAAEDLIAKIAATVPERLRPYVMEPASRAPPAWNVPADGLDLVKARAHIHAGRKIALAYRDERERRSQRTVWPVVIGYFQTVRLLGAWCELRKDFRTFRTDRVETVEFLDERYPERPAALRAKWQKWITQRRAADLAGALLRSAP
ncbi:MAG: WYL domain-containing protein, partial [Reyranella sp.]|nr:WYL domain-containing protein [Reyranella sp.]